MQSLDLDGHDPVREHSAQSVNEKIDNRMVESIVAVTKQGPEQIVARLGELDREWDIDRALMAKFCLVGGGSFALGLHRYVTTPLFQRRRKGFLYVFGSQLGFLLMHAAVGWCPPSTLLRYLGFRTQREIAAERTALRAAVVEHAPAM